MVPGAVAQRARHARALRRDHRARRARAVAALPAPLAAHARVGGRAVRARACCCRRCWRPRRRHAHRVVAGGHRRPLRARALRLLGAGARARGLAGDRADRRVDARVHRPALLAPLPALVPARRGLAVRRRAAAAGRRAGRLRRRRPRGPGAGAHAGLDRGADARAARRPIPAQAAALARIRSGFLDAYLGGARRRARRARRPRALAAAPLGPRHLPGRSRRDGAARLHDPRGQPRRPASRTPRCAAAAAAARPAACAWRAGWRTCRRRARPSSACSPASAPRPTCAWPARRGPPRDVGVAPLLAPLDRAPASALGADARQGHESEIAVLFADLRGFTRMAEHKLPYDVVFFLNRYFETVGTAITARRRRDQPVHRRRRDGAVRDRRRRRRPAAARRSRPPGRWSTALAALSAELAGDLPAPLRIGIGIHAGPAVVGPDGLGPELLPHRRRRHGARRRAAGAGDQGLRRRAGASPRTSRATRGSTCRRSPATSCRCATAPAASASASSRASPGWT